MSLELLQHEFLFLLSSEAVLLSFLLSRLCLFEQCCKRHQFVVLGLLRMGVMAFSVFVMHSGQIQTLGPGFGSMPARRRSSLSSESGTCLVVRHFKNTIPQTASYRLCPTCRKTGWRDDLTCMGWEVGCWVLAAGVVAGGDGA